jgi:uncharacterized membrane protein YeaQ/YmgE (transglycosylase-associated protein family)
MSLIVFLIIGAIAGWLAGQILQGSGYGLLGNIVIGIAGSLVGRFIAGLLHINFFDGFIGKIILAVIGALIFLYIFGKITQKKKEKA